MSDLIYSILGEKLFDFVKTTKNKEVIKRLFLQESRYNLSLLSILKWKDNNNEMSKYIITHLKNDIANIMLCNYKNDFLQLTAEQLTTFFSIDDLMDEPKPKDLLVQIVNKIHLLKVIANIPIELAENDNSNLDKRLSNLSKTLRLIIEIIDSK
jgi:hypothetical protein